MSEDIKKPRTRLTPKESRFVAEVMAKSTLKDAALAAYNVSEKNANIVANQVMKRDAVRLALMQRINDAVTGGDVTATIASRLAKVLEGTDDKLALAAIDRLMKIYGMEAPKQTENKNVNAKWTLPKE